MLVLEYELDQRLNNISELLDGLTKKGIDLVIERKLGEEEKLLVLLIKSARAIAPDKSQDQESRNAVLLRATDALRGVQECRHILRSRGDVEEPVVTVMVTSKFGNLYNQIY